MGDTTLIARLGELRGVLLYYANGEHLEYRPRFFPCTKVLEDIDGGCKAEDGLIILYEIEQLIGIDYEE